MKLAPEIVRYVLIGQGIVPGAINIVVNLLLGTLTFWGQDSVTTWGMNQGAVADSIGTCFFLPFITALIVTPIVRHHLARGTADRVPAIEVPWFFHWFEGSTLQRAAKFGIACLMLLALPIYFAYVVFAGDSIGTIRFIAIKAIFAGVLGLIVTPVIAMVAMCDQSASSQPRRT